MQLVYVLSGSSPALQSVDLLIKAPPYIVIVSYWK